MIGSLNQKKRNGQSLDALFAFIHSWHMRGQDELSVCSGALDVLRAFLGERPCCVWKRSGQNLSKVSERGMIDLFVSQESRDRENAVARCALSGNSEYDAVSMESFAPELKTANDGLIAVPIKIQEDVRGVMAITASKKEARDREFIQPLEFLAKLLGVAMQSATDRESSELLSKKLRAEVDSTSRELAQTNSRLIQRVQELKVLSQELEKRVEDLTHANKAKDEFLSMVSHELRTPLTSLKGFLCVLLDEEAGPVSESQKKFLSIAKQSADRLNVLISDLLDVSRIESGRLNLQMGVCSILDILQKSIEGQKKAAVAKSITLSLSSSAPSPEVMGDESRLQQVVDNILANAIKFTPHDGTVEVSLSDKGDGLFISIKDSGPGIEQPEQKKIFDMFYQVDASARRSTGGAGLGLAIANGIVSMHGGRLWVESEKGKGADFRFIVPRYKARNAA